MMVLNFVCFSEITFGATDVCQQTMNTEGSEVFGIVKEVRFQVLTAAIMKKTLLWDVAPRNLVEVYRRFIGTY
jgi:hypothetical protein